MRSTPDAWDPTPSHSIEAHLRIFQPVEPLYAVDHDSAEHHLHDCRDHQDQVRDPQQRALLWPSGDEIVHDAIMGDQYGVSWPGRRYSRTRNRVDHVAATPARPSGIHRRQQVVEDMPRAVLHEGQMGSAARRRRQRDHQLPGEAGPAGREWRPRRDHQAVHEEGPQGTEVPGSGLEYDTSCVAIIRARNREAGGEKTTYAFSWASADITHWSCY